MGHALDNTMQDIIIQLQKNAGLLYACGCLAQTHASIATEVKILQQLAERGYHKGKPNTRRVSGEGMGMVRSNTAGRIVEQLKSVLVHHVTGKDSDSQWMMAAQKLYAKYL